MRLVLLILALFTTCCSRMRPPEVARSSSAALVRDLSDETVALIVRNEDGDVIPYCSGVWVSARQFLTAAHCAAATVGEGGEVIGHPIAYIVQSEVTGHFAEPSRWHIGHVVKFDEAHDLALVWDEVTPIHRSATLADLAPLPGDALHFIGQDRGMYWTYMRGVMSGTWKELRSTTKHGPWLQVTAPVSNGMSGSGAFDESGRLVGIASMVAAAPDVALYVHLYTLQAFLRES